MAVCRNVPIDAQLIREDFNKEVTFRESSNAHLFLWET